MMRSILISVMASTLICATAFADDIGIKGKWKREDGNALVRIAPCGKNICATNLWIGDTSNGEEIDDRLVVSLTPSDPGTYSGNAYDPKRRLNYSILVRTRKGAHDAWVLHRQADRQGRVLGCGELAA